MDSRTLGIARNAANRRHMPLTGILTTVDAVGKSRSGLAEILDLK